MKSETVSRIRQLLAGIEYKGTGVMLDALLVDDIQCKGNELAFDLSVPVTGVAEAVVALLHERATAESIDLDAVSIGHKIDKASAINVSSSVAGVKNIIAVASGKGGVGKSTTSVNLALALAAEGARVGILDADIYGPSQPHMLGVDGVRPEVEEGKVILPVIAHGVQMISMGNMVTDKTPMVWRGPMASGALQQLLLNTRWEDVDYLIIDMPPGTGDIPLTLSQKVPVTGSVIVTTPQDIALLDAKKGVEMFQKVSIPVLGIVENMAIHVCTECGHEEHIFGEDGGRALAEEYGVDVLGQLPLAMAIRQQTDSGVPPLIDDPSSAVSQIYRDIARKVAVSVAQISGQSGPEILVLDD